MAKRRSMYRRTTDANFQVNVTSLMDFLTTMIFFFLSNYNVQEPYNPNGELRLPSSSIRRPLVDALKIIATRQTVSVGDVRVANIQEDALYDPKTNRRIDSQVIRPLLDQLKIEAQRSKEIAKLATPDKKFEEANVILEADATLPYNIIKRLMVTAGQTDFVLFKLTVSRKD